MSRLDKLIVKFFIFAAPFVAGFLITATMTNTAQEIAVLHEGWKLYLWNAFGVIFVSWTILGLFFLTKLVISAKLRKGFFSYFSSMRERDEREEQITGEAAKFSMLSTLALLFLFLFLNLFTVTFGKYSEDVRERENKHNYITMGMGFSTFNQHSVVKELKKGGLEVFTYTGVPISKSALILILVFWLFSTYHYSVKKQSEA